MFMGVPSLWLNTAPSAIVCSPTQFRNSLLIWQHLINFRKKMALTASIKSTLPTERLKIRHIEVSPGTTSKVLLIQSLQIAKHGLVLITSPPCIFHEFGRRFQLWHKKEVCIPQFFGETREKLLQHGASKSNITTCFHSWGQKDALGA